MHAVRCRCHPRGGFWPGRNGSHRCLFVPATGWYDMVAREVDAVRHQGWSHGYLGLCQARCVGSDAESFVSRMIAQRGATQAGRYRVDPSAQREGNYRGGDHGGSYRGRPVYFVCAAFFELRVRDWLHRHLTVDERVVIENVSQNYAAIALQGPKSRDVLAAVTQAPLDNNSFRWLTAQSIRSPGLI